MKLKHTLKIITIAAVVMSNCCLFGQMDPEKIHEVEDIVKLVRKTEPSSVIEPMTTIRVHSQLANNDEEQKVIKSEEHSSATSAQETSIWKKVTEESETAVNEIQQIFQEHNLENQETTQQLGKKAWNDYFSSDVSTWLLQSEEALEKSNQDQMQNGDKDYWKDLAEQYKIAADYARKALEAYILWESNKDNSWYWVINVLRLDEDCSEKDTRKNNWDLKIDILHLQANCYGKAAKAQERGKKILAAGYREAALTSQKAADQLELSKQKIKEKKWSERKNLHLEANSLQLKAEYQVKASEAQELRKTILAVSYREAAATSQRAADQYQQVALASITGAEKEGSRWHWIEKSLQAVGKSLQEKADYQVKAGEAQEIEKAQLAVGYREAAATSEKAAEQYQQAVRIQEVRSQAAERWDDGENWYLNGKILQEKAEYQVKASEAEEKGKEELAVCYQEIIATLMEATTYYQKAALAYDIENEEDGSQCHSIGMCFKSKAEDQIEAAKKREVGVQILFQGGRI